MELPPTGPAQVVDLRPHVQREPDPQVSSFYIIVLVVDFHPRVVTDVEPDSAAIPAPEFDTPFEGIASGEFVDAREHEMICHVEIRRMSEDRPEPFGSACHDPLERVEPEHIAGAREPGLAESRVELCRPLLLAPPVRRSQFCVVPGVWARQLSIDPRLRLEPEMPVNKVGAQVHDPEPKSRGR